LFLAETHKTDIKIIPREHSGFGWFLYHDALNVIGKKYGDTRKVLKQAQDFLDERSKKHRHHVGAGAATGHGGSFSLSAGKLERPHEKEHAEKTEKQEKAREGNVKKER